MLPNTSAQPSNDLDSVSEFDPLNDVDLLTEILRAFLPHPEDIKVEEKTDGQNTTLYIQVNPEDVGVVVGRDHATIYALRHIFSRIAIANGHRTYLYINGDHGQVTTRGVHIPEDRRHLHEDVRPRPRRTREFRRPF